jgi:SAM-dependent methyltransferase
MITFEQQLAHMPMTPALVDALCRATGTPEYYRVLAQRAIDNHLYLLHGARLRMIQSLLPGGECIVDLGGANAPLYRMGYPHAFTRLTLVDLPPEDRQAEYRLAVTEASAEAGEVHLEFRDMTDLSFIASGSVDFVWSGQSIEHVPRDAGRRMCKEAFRVLRRGGWFCLDTPNGLISRLHAATVGKQFIHPEHFVEYRPDELRLLLTEAGFEIPLERGLCEMPETVRTGLFSYEDFVFGAPISMSPERSYVQFYRCLKS